LFKLQAVGTMESGGASQQRGRIAGTTFKEARFRPPFSKNSIAFQKRLFYIPNQQYA
jgi:hypothetical protein